MFDGIRKFYSEKRNFALFATGVAIGLIAVIFLIPLSGKGAITIVLTVFGAVALLEIAHRILYKAPFLLK